MMVNERSHIYTPNFPGPYPADKWCAWRFCPPTNKRLKFIFNVFYLSRYDSIMIENGKMYSINEEILVTGNLTNERTNGRTDG